MVKRPRSVAEIARRTMKPMTWRFRHAFVRQNDLLMNNEDARPFLSAAVMPIDDVGL
jgi:hypothetical protein